MQKTIYESRIGIMPYSDGFLRKAVLNYQLYLLEKAELTEIIKHVNVIVTIPNCDSLKMEEEKIIQSKEHIKAWFMIWLNISCRVWTRIAVCDNYHLEFKYMRNSSSRNALGQKPYRNR